MRIRDIMTKDVATLRSDDTIERAARLMKQYDVGSIPVCTDDKIIGIITDRDIAVRSVAPGQVSEQRVGDVMSTNLVIGNPDMDVQDAASIMSDRQIRRLPIVENNSLVGIVSLGDISLESSTRGSAEEALKNISKPGGNII
ncbi:MAG: CBS domain-containing protein [Clostridiales bacterium]|jgi:CBS domain-containing protein|nr:CBS domain-containing protein [Bacillota bacterium]NLK04514.1 CBS domain-containing protein [Clostridiales bacterium]